MHAELLHEDLLQTHNSLHEDLLQNYNCSDQPAAAQPTQPSDAGGGAAAMRAKTRGLGTQAPRTTAEVVPPTASSSPQDQPPNRSTPIPAQRRLTQQISTHWPNSRLYASAMPAVPSGPGTGSILEPGTRPGERVKACQIGTGPHTSLKKEAVIWFLAARCGCPLSACSCDDAMHKSMYSYMHVYSFAYTCVCIHVMLYTRICTYYVHTCAYIYTHTHARTNAHTWCKL